MTGPLWIIPIEAVRDGADPHGTDMLVALACRHAELKPHATVSLDGHGFVAAVQYSLPGYVTRTEIAHVPLGWIVLENAIPADEVAR